MADVTVKEALCILATPYLWIILGALLFGSAIPNKSIARVLGLCIAGLGIGLRLVFYSASVRQLNPAFHMWLTQSGPATIGWISLFLGALSTHVGIELIKKDRIDGALLLMIAVIEAAVAVVLVILPAVPI